MSTTNRSSSSIPYGVTPQSSFYGAKPTGYLGSRSEPTSYEDQANASGPEDHLTSPTSTSKTKRRPCSQEWWLWELLAMVVSLGCMVTVIAIGIRTDNTALAEWTLPLGINTLFSLLATVAKAAMMLPIGECISQLKWLYLVKKERRLDTLAAFDNASKGPWGALLFLDPAKITSWPLLASLGAVLTLVAMAVGPFAQQTVAIRTESVVDPRTSFIPVASRSSDGITQAGKVLLGNNPVIDSKVQGAFYRGVFDLDSDLKYTCPSGNCTWPTFTSLAMCSSCEDVSDATKIEKSRFEATLTTPSGFEIQLGLMEFTNFTDNVTDSYVSSDLVAGNATFEYLFLSAPASPEEIVKTLSEKLVSLATVRTTGRNMENKTAGEKRTGDWTTTECTIRWCAKTYDNVEVVSGKINPYTVTEIPLKRGPLYGFPRNYPIAWDLVPRATSKDGKPLDTLYPLKDNAFTIFHGDHVGLALYMAKMFTFNTYSPSSASTNVFSMGSPFAEGQPFSTVLSKITDSLTHAIQSGAAANREAGGTTWKQEAIIHIDWLWLALPLAFVALGLALFVATVAINARQRWQPLWKSSAWPLVFQGLDEWTAQEQRAREDGSLREVDDMEEAAKRIRVTLQYNGLGARTLQRSW